MSNTYTLPEPPASVAIEAKGWHCHSQKKYVENVEDKLKKGAATGKPSPQLVSRLFPWAIDTRMLRDAWDQLAYRGGQAPGPDHRRYSDYDNHEAWALLTAVNMSLREGTFHRGEVAPVHVPKDILDPSRGDRTISLLCIVDRVVQRAIYRVLQPLVDPLFGGVGCNVESGERVFGFRRRRGRLHALAVAEYFAVSEHRKYWVSEDIENAFDNIPHGPLRDVLIAHVPCQKLVELIMHLVASGKTRGIHQGGPLSPLLLNLYLHHFLDRVWKTLHPNVPLLRYADDLLVLGRTLKEAKTYQAALVSILEPTGLQIKFPKKQKLVTRVASEKGTKWLGFNLRLDCGELRVGLTDKSIQRLGARLRLAHEKPNAPVRAVAMIKGWLTQMGPSYNFSDRATVLAKLRSIAAAEGFDELPRDKVLASWWRSPSNQWNQIRDELKSPPLQPVTIDQSWFTQDANLSLDVCPFAPN